MRQILSVLGLAAIVAAQGYGTPASINTGAAQGSYGSPYGIQPSYQQQQYYTPPTGQAHDSRPDFNQLFQQNQQNSIVSPPRQIEQPRQQFNQPALINQQPLISTVSNQVQQQPQQQQTPSSYYGVPSGPFQTGFAGYPAYPTGYGTVQTMNNPYIMYGQQPFEWQRGTVITSQLSQTNNPTNHGQNEQNRPRNEIAAVGYGPASSSIQPASQAYGNPYYGTQYQQQQMFGPSARATGNMERTQETATTTSTTTERPVIVTSRPVLARPTNSGSSDRSPIQETSGPSGTAGPATQEVDPWASIASSVNGVTNKKASEIQRSKNDH